MAWHILGLLHDLRGVPAWDERGRTSPTVRKWTHTPQSIRPVHQPRRNASEGYLESFSCDLGGLRRTPPLDEDLLLASRTSTSHTNTKGKHRYLTALTTKHAATCKGEVEEGCSFVLLATCRLLPLQPCSGANPKWDQH